MSPPLHAFVDESTRNSDYLICAATVSTTDLAVTRKQLQGLLATGQRRLHFTDESDPKRRKILSAMTEMETSTTIYVATSRNQDLARASILETMVPQLRDRGVSRLMLDAREGQDSKDRATIYRQVGPHPQPEFAYVHQRSATEPLLWIPDAVAWAWGRGGQWRAMVTASGLAGSVVTVQVG